MYKAVFCENFVVAFQERQPARVAPGLNTGLGTGICQNRDDWGVFFVKTPPTSPPKKQNRLKILVINTLSLMCCSGDGS